MIINILKDTEWIDELVPHTEELLSFFVGFPNLHEWFIPAKYRQVKMSRNYCDEGLSEKDQIVYEREEYKLPFHLSNYLPLFLIKKLYSDKKDTLIEDVGTADGKLMYYLGKSGFRNFSTFDNWSECSKELYLKVISGLSCIENELSVNPVIINNTSAPRFCFIAPGIYPERECQFNPYRNIERDLSNLELIVFYCNILWEKEAKEALPRQGFTFLCQDTDHLGVAYCRNDKLKEFKEKLEDYTSNLT